MIPPDEPLPGMPELPVRHPPAERAGERVSRYTAQARRLCDACTFYIHRYGQGGAPYPKHARWQIATETKTRYLCNDHKDTRL